MLPIRVACVRYLNTSVLVEGLSALDEVRLIPTVPSRIAEMVLGGEADIGLVSLADALRGGGGGGEGGSDSSGLTLLPVGMIGCDGPTLTVRVFSRVPLDEITEIHADTDSHTSVALAQVVFRARYGRMVGVKPFDAREHMPVWLSGGSEEGAWPEAMLLIGDKVVTDSPPAVRYPYQVDLGEAWHGLTGLPFVYAVWACRTGEEGSEGVRRGCEILDRTLRHNMTRIDWIITRRAGEHRWPLDLARMYLGSLLRFGIGERERRGASEFAKRAHGLGIVDQGTLRWFDGAGAPSACV
ncbi:MAG: menaquinone biosynthesis protein [Phycisphaeraceae bacterium]|nr:menaquinone biosynthesis protein [Phycisphaeraceae bacterium]MBX3368263.1 menaquinone biosynthesis protein [Phycisphaeraceae bacterium]